MIQYSLKCADGHVFESWFQSADAFDKLAASGMVSCAVCGSGDVSKSMMAPRVRPSRKAVQGPSDAARSDAARSDAAPKPAKGALQAPGSELEKAVAELRRQVESKADYVGLEFAAEARAIHEGESPERAIYGEAKPEEAKKLLEDGVRVTPLPFMPNRKTN